MKTVGLITEYNPFHNGHLYHLNKAKELTGADYVVVVMSGNFLQRGVPALMDKYTRSRMALQNGADLVLELPAYYATGSAEYFANGAVAILDKLGVVDSLCFGCEDGELSLFEQAAEVLQAEPDEWKERMQGLLREGNTYPAARSRALAEYLDNPRMEEFLNRPNNILGLEYIRAIRVRNSSIRPVLLPRQGAGYHDKQITGEICSASAIREALIRGVSTEELKGQLPESVSISMEENYRKIYPIYEDDFSTMLKYKLMQRERPPLTDYVDISEDLAARILNQLNSYKTFKSFADQIKTRQLTYTRVCRAFLHILLEIRKENMEQFVSADYAGYARVLGLRRSAGGLFKAIKERSRIPLLSKLVDAGETLTNGFREMLEHDIWCADVYHTVVTDKYGAEFVSEFSREIPFEK